MAVYARQIAQAKRMIKAKGELCTWKKHHAVSTNPQQPWKTVKADPIPDPLFASIVFTNPGAKLDALFHLINGTSIPQGAPSGIMAQVPFTPEINDSVVRSSGEELVIKSFNIVAPNGEVILYKLSFA